MVDTLVLGTSLKRVGVRVSPGAPNICPCGPTGRGDRLKIGMLGVQIPPGAPRIRKGGRAVDGSSLEN